MSLLSWLLALSIAHGSPPHVTMGIFEMHNITNASMANQAKVLFDSFGLLDNIVAYVKAKGSNLFTLTITLTIVVSCLPFQLPCPFVKSCFGHVCQRHVSYMLVIMPKFCTWFCRSEHETYSKFIKKIITLINFFGKGGQKWKKSCVIARLSIKMFKLL
jgi:hypothetical protein